MTKVVKTSVKEKKHKLKINEIKKNSSSDVSHSIRKIQEHETKFVFLFVVVILVVLFSLGNLLFLSVQSGDLGAKNEKMTVSFFDNEAGMSDIISLDENTKDVTIEFNISNNNDFEQEYKVYLEDYGDMISYHECEGTMLDKDKIYLSIDNKEVILLSNIYQNRDYIVIQDTIKEDTVRSHVLKIWYDGVEDGHYHGKIVVE